MTLTAIPVTPIFGPRRQDFPEISQILVDGPTPVVIRSRAIVDLSCQNLPRINWHIQRMPHH